MLPIDSVPGVVVALAFLGGSADASAARVGTVALVAPLADAIEVSRLQGIGLANLERGAKGKLPTKPLRTTLRDRPLRSRVFPFLRR